MKLMMSYFMTWLSMMMCFPNLYEYVFSDPDFVLLVRAGCISLFVILLFYNFFTSLTLSFEFDEDQYTQQVEFNIFVYVGLLIVIGLLFILVNIQILSFMPGYLQFTALLAVFFAAIKAAAFIFKKL